MTEILQLVYAASVLFMAWCFLDEVLCGEDTDPVSLAELLGTLAVALFPGINTLASLVVLSGLSDVIVWRPRGTSHKN